jgi:hypothetical protein
MDRCVAATYTGYIYRLHQNIREVGPNPHSAFLLFCLLHPHFMHSNGDEHVLVQYISFYICLRKKIPSCKTVPKYAIMMAYFGTVLLQETT